MWFSAALAAPSPWTVTPELGTELPLRVGAGVRVEGPHRLRAGLAVGAVPGPYVALANDVCTSLFPDYTESYAALVEAAIASSVVVRGDLGWRPLPRSGWWFAAGGSWVGLGGSATAAELVEGLVGTTVPRAPGLAEVEAAASLGLVDVTTGWDARVWRSLVLRPSVGWSFTVAARSRIEAPEPERGLRDDSAAALEAAAEAALDPIFTSYVHPPDLGLAVGWSFGPRGRAAQRSSSP